MYVCSSFQADLYTSVALISPAGVVVVITLPERSSLCCFTPALNRVLDYPLSQNGSNSVSDFLPMTNFDFQETNVWRISILRVSLQGSDTNDGTDEFFHKLHSICHLQ